MPALLTSLRFGIRTKDPSVLRGAAATALRRIDPGATLELRTLEDQGADSISRERLLAWIGSAFAIFGVLTALLGLYGTFVYEAERRRSDYALRIALGADAGHILRAAIGGTALVAIGGAVIGVGLLVTVGPILRGVLFDVDAADPLTMATSIAALLGASGVACYRGLRPVLTSDITVLLKTE